MSILTSILLSTLTLAAIACLWLTRRWLAAHWRIVLARLPLPMLALAASYGVYRFALLFVPSWVAIIQAAAFEATYVGLAALDQLDGDGRKRASRISVGAVIVSILYNSLDGLFHRYPSILVNLDVAPWGLGLALLHGAPLAWVAYLVSDLLLHRKPEAASKSEHPRRRAASLRALRPRVVIAPVAERALPVSSVKVDAVDKTASKLVDTPVDDTTLEVVRLRDVEQLSFGEIGVKLGFSRQAAQSRYKAAKLS